VLTRAFGIEGFPGDKAVEARLWRLAESLLPERDVEAYTQGLMDLGATVCSRTRPDCLRCPLAASCVARREGRTAELPAPRPKRARPRRRTTVLVLHRDGHVLVVRRPAPGIWGGLLGLPELPEGEAAAPFALRAFGCTVASVRDLAPLRHGFTHFDLELRPLLCEVANAAPALHESGPVWLKVSEHGSAPLPAPVRKLLQGLNVQASPAPAVRLP
jgi:A/G-specific adenine glycosylase